MAVLAILAQLVRIAMPYLFAAAGGVVSERAGIIALTLEGYMLTGAFCTMLGSFYTGNPWLGLLCGIAGGGVAGLLHALATVRFRADQVVAGVALNLLVAGATTFFLRLLFDSTSNSPRIAGFAETGAAGLGAALTNPLVWLGLVTLPLLAFLLYRTPFGLRVRATGEHPAAAETLGVSVPKVRMTAVALSGMLAGIGGAFLALDQHQFTSGMTAGRGFIAIAAVIFGRWDPKRVLLACFLFAAAETLQIQLQGTTLVASQFVEMIPYVLTIVALAGVVGRAAAPAALGRHHRD